LPSKLATISPGDGAKKALNHTGHAVDIAFFQAGIETGLNANFLVCQICVSVDEVIVQHNLDLQIGDL
ncbi:MAG: hypothetical protein U9N77_14075, partial [Thermodesulfobacteriota bacterium]|nr:hypothetical protein [Thermodesulfobacteriota bacterium]